MNSPEFLFLVRKVDPSLTDAEAHFFSLICRAETGFGEGWKEGKGKGSNNVGATQAGKAWVDAGKPTFETTDHHEDGSPYVGKFRVYPTLEEGIRDTIRILLKPNVRDALRASNGTLAIQRQRENGYFELKLADYWKRIAESYPEFLSKVKEVAALTFPPLPKEEPSSPSFSSEEPPTLPQDDIVRRLRPPNTTRIKVDLPTLRLGQFGTAVELLQKLLKVTVTGTFDDATLRAVAKFQEAEFGEGPAVDGFVGKNTWGRLVR